MALLAAVRSWFTSMLGRSAGARPDPRGVGLFDEAEDADTGNYYKCLIDPVTGQQVWRLLSGGGGGASGWPPYVVSKGDPAAPYALPSAAIAAAVAAGHGPANPVDILIFPGTYVEAAGLSLPGGINLIGFSGENDGQVVIQTVQLTVAGSGTATTTLAGLKVVGRLALSGTGTGTTFVRQCTATAGVLFNNLAGGAALLEVCTLLNAPGSPPLATVAGTGAITLRDCAVTSSGGPAASLAGAQCTFLGAASLVTGPVAVAGVANVAIFQGGEIDAIDATDLFQIGPGAFVTVRAPVLVNNALGGRLVSGGGTLLSRDLDLGAGSSDQVAAGTTARLALFTERLYTSKGLTVTGGTTNLTFADVEGADVIVVTGPGSIINLPPTTSMPGGRRLTFAWTATVAGMIFGAQVGDKIAGAADQNYGASVSGATWQSDGAGNWIQIATYVVTAA